MKIDLLQILYTVVMVILAFLAAVVVTKTVGKYFSKEEHEEEK